MSVILSNRTPLLCLWLALIVTFAITRVVTARIRKGSTGLRNWSVGGIPACAVGTDGQPSERPL